jgi:hypothetical protein
MSEFKKTITEIEAHVDSVLDDTLDHLFEDLSRNEAQFALTYFIKKLDEIEVNDFIDSDH